jgi:hypothetical protein
MDAQELKRKLKNLNIPEDWYSIDGGLKPDAYILENIYGRWVFYYFDEKGNRQNERKFDSERKACLYLFDKILTELKYPPSKFPVKF